LSGWTGQKKLINKIADFRLPNFPLPFYLRFIHPISVPAVTLTLYGLPHDAAGILFISGGALRPWELVSPGAEQAAPEQSTHEELAFHEPQVPCWIQRADERLWALLPYSQ
jgi:hypothetical protein